MLASVILKYKAIGYMKCLALLSFHHTSSYVRHIVIAESRNLKKCSFCVLLCAANISQTVRRLLVG